MANAEPVKFAICHLPFATCDAAKRFETVTEVAPCFIPLGFSVFSNQPHHEALAETLEL